MGLGRDDLKAPGKPDGGLAGRFAPAGGLTAGTSSTGQGSRGARTGSIEFGSTLDHFEILELLGSGGFGEVYRARDTRLGRMVAVKVLPGEFARDAERRERLRREAMAASALNHPNICAVYDLVEVEEKCLIVMELVEGRTLQEVLAEGALLPASAVPLALQIAGALAEAHDAGIVHRDIKSGNIIVTARGQAKVLDFGLAKRLGPASGPGDPAAALTREGAAPGTLSYMSPEQLLGKPVDRRTDLFSLGVVLYEMVTGRLPFQGPSAVAVADAILHAEPRDFSGTDLPGRLKAIIRRLLEKDPARRYARAEKVCEELAELQADLNPARPARLANSARLWIAASAIGLALLAGWLWHRASRTRWARETATPEIARLVAAEDFGKAAALSREALSVLPGDPTLARFFEQATMEIFVDSVPTGADVAVRPYRGDPRRWEALGKTPLAKARVPKGFYLWRVGKHGFENVYEISPTWGITPGQAPRLFFRLDPEGSIPREMVRVPGGRTGLAIPGLDHLPEVPLDDYLIDRHEVTNEEYKRFVDAGGYQRRDLWKQPFVKDGRTILWDEGVALFRDTTGRPGPATWDLGSFPKGLADHPVTGVSWYEAAAAAEFFGKSLPTVYHWNRAAQTRASQLIAPGSNFQGEGTVVVGGDGAISGFGTTDMAGNVKEWCWNEGAGGRRFILGGGFGEPSYMFIAPDAQSPWDRRPNYGFRCAKVPSPPSEDAAGRIEVPSRDFSKEKPVSSEVFRAYKGLYAYDKRELNARVEETETTEDWTREKVSFDAAYGSERVIAHLFLPRDVFPPYQTVVYFPGSSAIHADRFSLAQYADFIPKSGRALLAPIYKSTFERSDELTSAVPEPTAFWRDHMTAWSKDLGRSVDYLETRKEIDHGNLAFLSLSWGSAVAPVLLAVEDRFRTAVLLSGGLRFRSALPEAEQVNFAPRVRIPVLMLNGRYDHIFPVETSQDPLFRLLGAPAGDKKHVVWDSGHAPPLKDLIRESLDWLDKYLGPVKR